MKYCKTHRLFLASMRIVAPAASDAKNITIVVSDVVKGDYVNFARPLMSSMPKPFYQADYQQKK
jgi:hypothetical protein